MISIKKDCPKKERFKKYPYLGVSTYENSNNEFIVLFSGKDEGTVVYSDDNGVNSKYTPGEYSDSWIEAIFKEYSGEITLRNEWQ